MPNYDYQCQSCGVFEHFQSMTSKPLAKCPKCGKKVIRLISGGGGVLFKGSGFYQTDYRSKSYSEGSKKEKPKSCGDSGCSSKKSD